MAEQIEARDIEKSARLVKTGMDLLESWEKTRARELELRRVTFEEVEFRKRYGDTDGMLDVWEESLGDIDVGLFETNREIQEVKDEVEEVQKTMTRFSWFRKNLNG